MVCLVYLRSKSVFLGPLFTDEGVLDPSAVAKDVSGSIIDRQLGAWTGPYNQRRCLLVNCRPLGTLMSKSLFLGPLSTNDRVLGPSAIEDNS